MDYYWGTRQHCQPCEIEVFKVISKGAMNAHPEASNGSAAATASQYINEQLRLLGY